MAFFETKAQARSDERAHMLRIGVDVGGTFIRASIFAPDMRLLSLARAHSPQGGFAVAEAICHTVEKALDALHGPAPDLAGIGIGIPGTVDASTGTVRNAVNLGIHELALADRVREHFGVRVTVENDVNVAAAGASLVLPEGHDSLAYLNLGTGTSAGMIRDGRLVHGAHGIAGEIGHIVLERGGVRCGCGQHGCLETLVSGSALARLWPVEHGWPAQALFSAAASGNAKAVHVRDTYCFHLFQAVEILALAIDPTLIVLGGGVTSIGLPLLTGLRREISRAEKDSPFVASLHLSERVRLVPPHADVACLGAAHCAVPFNLHARKVESDEASERISNNKKGR